MHELVDVTRSLFRRVGSGIRSTKDADGINGGLAVLHLFGSRHGSLGDARIKLADARWLAVGKEHNNLLGVFAARSDIPGQFQTMVGMRGAGRFDSSNFILEIGCLAAGTIGQALHYLRVVVPKLPLLVLVIADFIGLIARKLNNGNPMLPIDTLDTLVLLGDGIDKAVGSALERIDTLGAISATHRIIHRARGIQHHHDIERRGDRHGRIGRRGHRRKRSQEVRLFVFSGCLNRFVGPDSADVLGRYFIAAVAGRPFFPASAGVGVDDRRSTHCRSVHSCAGPGVGLGQHGECCSRQHQHYGQYHRQETPRVLTHRVSLLAVSDLASA